MKNAFIIHHTDLDGICAAIIVHEYIRLNHPECEHIVSSGYRYHQEIRDNKLLQGEEFDAGFIVDCSFTETTKDQLLWLKSRCNKLSWFDHHVSSQALSELPELQDADCFIDTSRCGALIAWEKLFPKLGATRALLYVNDYDLWLHKSSYSALFHAGVCGTCLDVFSDKLFYVLFDRDRDDPEDNEEGDAILEELIQYGQAIINTKKTENENLCRKGLFEATFEGISCYAINRMGEGSDAFGKKFKKKSLCVRFFFTGDQWSYGLYSQDAVINCAELAEKFGGGGHPGAAGFSHKEFLLKDCRKVY